MQIVQWSDLPTVVVGLAALMIGKRLSAWIPILSRLSIPSPVLGGLLAAALVAAARPLLGVEIRFGTTITDFLLLVFFTTVGLSAKLSALRKGGKPLVILCAMTLLLILVQNAVGIGVALSFGAHPFYGLLVGSISCVGGPGTAAAWAKEAQAVGLEAAPEVAVAGATLAVVIGAMVAGPITGWIVARHGLKPKGRKGAASWHSGEEKEEPPAPPMEEVFQTFFLILIAVLIGLKINEWSKSIGFVLPGFLTAMLAGVLITNVADLTGKRINFGPIERDGEFALQTFLVMYLMSLKLWILGAAIVPLMVNIALQVVAATLLAYLVLFRLLGRDYDAALTVGGYLGFGLSSMTVGMASMDEVATRHGPSPKAFLLVTLAGSFFVDLANAFAVKGFLLLPIFGS